MGFQKNSENGFFLGGFGSKIYIFILYIGMYLLCMRIQFKKYMYILYKYHFYKWVGLFDVI